MAEVQIGAISWERMIRAVEKVRERVIRASTTLEKSGIPHAVVGGNAVAAWVSTIDEAAVRNTQDVDILVRRDDMDRVTAALSDVGFVWTNVLGIDMFLDGPDGRPRDAVHILFAGEKVRPEYVTPAPDVTESLLGPQFRYLALEPLVRMKLTSFRRKDQVHIEDMIDVGLIDAGWTQRLPSELAARLQEILDTPGG